MLTSLLLCLKKCQFYIILYKGKLLPKVGDISIEVKINQQKDFWKTWMNTEINSGPVKRLPKRKICGITCYDLNVCAVAKFTCRYPHSQSDGYQEVGPLESDWALRTPPSRMGFVSF